MPKTQLLLICLCTSFIIIQSCKKEVAIPVDDNTPIVEPIPQNNGLTYLDASPQRKGDPDAGYDYLVYGGYVNGGIPYDLYVNFIGSSSANYLNREGDNANVDFTHTAINAFNGTKVVTSNCLQCHATKLNEEFIIGLGNTNFDYTKDQSENLLLANAAIEGIYGRESPEWEAYEPFRRAYFAIAPYIQTEVRGVNPADKLAAVLAAHRNKYDLSWLPSAQLPIEDKVIPTDVPPWWVMKKKNALYYTGLGRGDFARMMMASSVLTLQDTTEARKIDQRFVDIQAFIETLEAPIYPNEIYPEKYSRGVLVFNNKCASCHGHYGEHEDYPNLLVDLDIVGTDPELTTSSFAYAYFVDWYNSSWFSKEPFKAYIQPQSGYVAPPLDGIWASAPYLHNGSVPTLEDLLNSTQRPTFWKRTFLNNDYDFEKVGWNYTVESEGSDNHTYNTLLSGYSNQGHTFGDNLTDEERSDLIEYLKTL